jgi:hypothetical protein
MKLVGAPVKRVETLASFAVRRAMQAIETRTGMKMPADRVDAAMHRLSQASKVS